MGWFARPEPALSRACCAGLDLYSPTGKFQITPAGFRDEILTSPHSRTGRSVPLDWRQLALSAAAATDRRQSQSGANSERRSGSNRALTTGKLSDPVLSRLRYWGGQSSSCSSLSRWWSCYTSVCRTRTWCLSPEEVVVNSCLGIKNNYILHIG